MSKSFFNITQGVVNVTASATQGLDRAFNTSAIRKAVFLIRTYNVSTLGTLSLESSNQNVDDNTNLWISVGSLVFSGGSGESNALFKIVADEDELFTYVRWRFALNTGSAGTTFEITGYSLD